MPVCRQAGERRVHGCTRTLQATASGEQALESDACAADGGGSASQAAARARAQERCARRRWARGRKRRVGCEACGTRQRRRQGVVAVARSAAPTASWSEGAGDEARVRERCVEEAAAAQHAAARRVRVPRPSSLRVWETRAAAVCVPCFAACLCCVCAAPLLCGVLAFAAQPNGHGAAAWDASADNELGSRASGRVPSQHASTSPLSGSSSRSRLVLVCVDEQERRARQQALSALSDGCLFVHALGQARCRGHLTLVLLPAWQRLL
jgi:hypothetical protein